MLKLELSRSRSLLMIFGLAHGFALLLLPWSGLPAWGNLLLGVGIVLSGIHAVALHAWHLMKSSIIGMELRDDCKLRVCERQGAWLDAEIHASSFVMPFLTVLNFRVAGQRGLRHVLIVPDRVDAESFRRLRVWLRWRCAGSGLEEKTVF